VLEQVETNDLRGTGTIQRVMKKYLPVLLAKVLVVLPWLLQVYVLAIVLEILVIVGISEIGQLTLTTF
jgi:hypothetical protein